ncbi:MAG: efflux RND transporter periplasmic adaptor subunit [Planctomycetes bacterium]|nr:efflux RND transporter periplasmic adaptor subunit [Planctomycetota bacterium]
MRTVIISLAILAIAGCGGPPEMPHMPPPQVGVAAPLERSLPIERVISGRIEAVESVELSPQVSGIVQQVLAKDGAEVKAGDPVLVIDPAPYKAALARAEAGVAQAEANLRLATDARDRNAKLHKDNLVAQQVYDDSVTAAVAAEAALAAARAALTTAQLDLSYTTVRAPISGRLGTVKTTVGNLVQGGGGFPPSVITSLVSIDPVYATVDLDEVTYRRVAARISASVAGGEPVRVRVGLAGEEGLAHEGRVTFVDNRVDPGSGSIRLRATIANPDRRLTPGSFARVALEVDAPRPVLLVHEQAIQAQLATRYVLVVDEQGMTSFRPVQPGAAHGVLREVDGVKPGERMVVTNLAKVFFPGMPVAPMPADMETLQVQGAPAAAPAGK